MMRPLQAGDIPAFTAACAYERVFGSKALTALRAYGPADSRVQFHLLTAGGAPTAALYLANGVLVVSACAQADPAPIAALVREAHVREVDTNLEQAQALQALLGGSIEQSYYMVYSGDEVSGDFSAITLGVLPEVFSVLQQSHEYYRTHLRFAPWAADLSLRLNKGLSELYQLTRNGEVVATGCIASQDDECGVIAAVAVIPSCRHQGLGSEMSRFLVRRILQMGKTPRLISGYDAVATLYRQIGFVPCGQWGELYL